MAGPLRLATRGSTLARAQAQTVADRLDVECELVVVSTTGDRRSDVPIWQMGGQGVFVKEIQEAVLEGRADAAVHSAKDLPSTTPPGLALAAFPERLDPRDALVGATRDELPTGATVATGSIRRRAQLAYWRPDLGFAPLRGNIETRLDRAGAVDAAVMSAAALDRLDRGAEADERLDPRVMLPQVGQGALAVECRADDGDTRDLVEKIDVPEVAAAVTAERAFLAGLGGGCNVPVGALAHSDGRGVSIEGLWATPDGRIVLRHRVEAPDPEQAGRILADELRSERGGEAVLQEWSEVVRS